ncbi:MAG: hypothetical protein ACYCTB_11870 [bacterium]
MSKGKEIREINVLEEHNKIITEKEQWWTNPLWKKNEFTEKDIFTESDIKNAIDTLSNIFDEKWVKKQMNNPGVIKKKFDNSSDADKKRLVKRMINKYNSTSFVHFFLYKLLLLV